ncbi:hypothetical protein PENTCL1PPCAC_4636, partial [Pristionchus entomophagus]
FQMSSKILVFLLLIVFVAVQVESTYVQACDEVCDRTVEEKNECCRAHGFDGMLNGGHCDGGQAHC